MLFIALGQGQRFAANAWRNKSSARWEMANLNVSRSTGLY
jgi:hypothetical protein